MFSNSDTKVNHLSEIVNLHRALQLLTVFTLLITLVAPVHAGHEPPISLVTAEFPPYNYTQDNKIVGSSTAIIKAVFERMKMETTIDLLPPKRAMAMAARGQADGYFTFTKNPQRLKEYYYSLPLSTIGDVFFKKRDLIVEWATMSDLKGYTIGATQGYNYATDFLNAMENKVIDVDLIVGQTPEVMHLKRLNIGRVDLIICEVTLCSHIVRTHPEQFQNIDYVDRLIGPVRTFHLGFSRKWPNAKLIADKFNQTFLQLLEEGTIAAIHQKYGTRRDILGAK